MERKQVLMETQIKKQNELLEKADKALKQHKEMGESLEALKKQAEKDGDKDCGEDDKGWKNIQEFFKGSTGKKRAEKIVTFMEMLGKKKE